jgi:hypothetical protein
MGPGPMTAPRESALLSLFRNTGCAHAHITADSFAGWVVPAYPVHPAFQYLSAVHKCDYLRCYVLHVHGGGYADVKHTTKNWHPFFDALERSPAFGLGYTEVGPHGVARVGGSLEAEMQANYTRLVGLCAMIFRPKTLFTHEWYELLFELLDAKSDELAKNPARHPQDRLGASFTDGSVSAYPLAWTAVGGDIFHPLVYKHSEHILHADLAPSFENYR